MRKPLTPPRRSQLALQALSFFMPGDSGRQIVDHADELYERALRSGASRSTADARYRSFVKGNALGILAEVARAFAYGYWGFVYAYMAALALLAGIMSFMKFLVHARLLYADTLGQVIAIVLIALIFVGSGVVAGAVSSAHARQTASATAAVFVGLMAGQGVHTFSAVIELVVIAGSVIAGSEIALRLPLLMRFGRIANLVNLP